MKRTCDSSKPEAKVPIAPHHLQIRYYAPPPIAITRNRLTRLGTDTYSAISIQLFTSWVMDLIGAMP